jgi:hypothetical protein
MSFPRAADKASSTADNQSDVASKNAEKRATPKQLSAALNELYEHKLKKNMGMFRTKKALENPRNNLLANTAELIQNRLEDTEENYIFCKNQIAKLIGDNLQLTMLWLIKEKKNNKDLGKLLGKLHRNCIELMPEALVELLWMKRLGLYVTPNKSQYKVDYDDLMYKISEDTQKAIKTNPAFQALTLDVVELRKNIFQTMSNLAVRFQKKEIIVEPLNDKDLLSQAFALLDGWIKSGSWDDNHYQKIKTDVQNKSSQCYVGTRNLLETVTAYCDAVSATLQNNKKSIELRAKI